MTDYTPTTEEVRKNWQENRNLRGGVIGMFSIEQFDRWLAGVKADAWEEGCRWGAVEFQTLDGKLQDEHKVQVTDADNPYREEAK